MFRAPIDYVGVCFHEIEGFVVDRFGDDPKPNFARTFARFLVLLRPGLKTVWRSARLVGAATEQADAVA